MFIPRIWMDEVERIGKRRCTPMGYALHVLGDMIGFFGLLILLVTSLYLASMVVVGKLTWSLAWLLTIPFIFGVVGSILTNFSWSLATRKKFRYDYELRTSTWIENGSLKEFTLVELLRDREIRPKI